MQKILIIQTAFIGDVILSTSVIEKLHAFYPHAQIDFLLRKGNHGLLQNHPYIKNLWIWDKAQKWSSWWTILKSVRQEKYDLVINLQRYTSMALLAALSKGKTIVGYDSAWPSKFYTQSFKHELDITGKTQSPHEVERYQTLIEAYTDKIAAKPKLYPTLAHKEFVAAKFLEWSSGTISLEMPYVCMAPASVWFTKQLPIAKWIELGNKLSDDIAIVFLGGPGDKALCDSVIAQIPNKKIINTAGGFNFMQSAIAMQYAKMNYVNDSGPLHIASAMDAPSTAFFCSTMPEFGFRPLSTQSCVAATKEALDCRPCGVHGYKSCPKGHFKCGNIAVEDYLV